MDTTTPPSRIINTPAKLFTSRLCVFPVLDCEGFGHWLRSSHQVRRALSMKFLSRNYEQSKIIIIIVIIIENNIIIIIKTFPESFSPEKFQIPNNFVNFLLQQDATP